MSIQKKPRIYELPWLETYQHDFFASKMETLLPSHLIQTIHQVKIKIYDNQSQNNNTNHENTKYMTTNLPSSSLYLLLQTIQSVFEKYDLKVRLLGSAANPGWSLYIDSCQLLDSYSCEHHNNNNDNDENPAVVAQKTICSPLKCAKSFLITMMGLHPHQEEIEHIYQSSIRPIHVMMTLWKLLQSKSSKLAANQDEIIQNILSKTRTTLNSIPQETTCWKTMFLWDQIVAMDSQFSIDSIHREYERLEATNFTCSNVFWNHFHANKDLWMDSHNVLIIRDVLYHSSLTDPSYARISVSIDPMSFDSNHFSTENNTPPFSFLPALSSVLSTQGPESLISSMIQYLWSYMWQHFGYVITSDLKCQLEDPLRQYLASGLGGQDSPFSLRARFHPSYSLSLYLYGMSGTGKSSFVRYFPQALQQTLVTYVDPDIKVRFVKQILNQPIDNLDMDLTRKPNNNDLSLMAIIQSRRMTMTQTKPGLVVVALEEMPSTEHCNPNQEDVCHLIQQQFSGRRNGNYSKTKREQQSQNSKTNGIDKDAAIITLFTSNYELQNDGKQALQTLNMFSNLKSIPLNVLEGPDRENFAYTYMRQQISDRMNLSLCSNHTLHLEIDFGVGDIRPLIRFLRMMALHTCRLMMKHGHSSNISVKQMELDQTMIVLQVGDELMELNVVGTMNNLIIPKIVSSSLDERTRDVIRHLNSKDYGSTELDQVMDYFFTKTFSPTVVISSRVDFLSSFVESMAQCSDVYVIRFVNVSEIKLMKSLYDPPGIRNLRDDIWKRPYGIYCVVEVLCYDAESQLQVRDLLDDTPSRTSFSSNDTNNIAPFRKDGLCFCVYVKTELSPELQSRASWIMGE